MVVGNRIREILKEKNMRPTELASKTGFQDSYLNRIMSGHIKNVTMPTAFKIAKALEMPLENIFIVGRDK